LALRIKDVAESLGYVNSLLKAKTHEIVEEFLYRSRIGSFWKVYRVARNWYDVLAVRLGLREHCVVYTRSGRSYVISRSAWDDAWKHINVEFLEAESKSKLRILALSMDKSKGEGVIAFRWLGKEVVLYFPLIGFYGLINAMKDSFVEESYRSLNVNSRCVVDVGAYIGDTAVYFALKGAWKVLAVEPHPYTYSFLARNIEENLLSRVVIPVNACVGGKEEVIRIPYLKEDSLSKPLRNHGLGVEVPCYNLQRLVEELKVYCEDRDLVLKMDCEGCEYDAILNSDGETLRMFREIILEFHDSPKPLIDKLRKSGFEVRSVKPTILFAKAS